MQIRQSGSTDGVPTWELPPCPGVWVDTVGFGVGEDKFTLDPPVLMEPGKRYAARLEDGKMVVREVGDGQ